MIIEFDPLKNARNIRERDLSFERVADVDWSSARVFVDERNDYGETRYIALCYLERRLHVLCFTEIKEGIRVISFRRANKREVKRHGTSQSPD